MQIQDYVAITAGVAIGSTFLGALTRSAAAFFGKVLSHLFSAVWLKKELKDLPMSEMVLSYLNSHCKSYLIGKESFITGQSFVKKEKKYRYVPYRETVESQRLYIYNGLPILLTPKTEGRGDNSGSPASISYLRWFVDIEKLITAAAIRQHKTWDSRHSGTLIRYQVRKFFGSKGTKEKGDVIEYFDPAPKKFEDNDWSRKPIGWAIEELGRVPAKLPGVSALCLTAPVKRIIKDFVFWYNSKEWYASRKIPERWKRGYCFFGKPGTGKTSLAKALAQECNLPIYIFDLASMTNKELGGFWTTAVRNTPCVILIEDIDGVFHGRKNVVENGELTFNALLNCIDGIDDTSGIALIVTTNHIELVDPALGGRASEEAVGSTRPGRVDVTMELPGLDYEARVELAKKILDDEVEARRLAEEHTNFTAVQFQEICLKVAQKKYWESASKEAAE